MMVLLAVLFLAAGFLCGGVFFSPETTAFFSESSKWVLYLLMFSVGVSVGANRQVFHQMRQYHVRILVIPACIIAGSLVGGALCSWLAGRPLAQGLSVSSGLGWYSLAGVMLTELSGPAVGSLAFLSNLMRELVSFLIIPFLAKRLGPYAAIAPAAATSEDTTLSLLRRYTGETAAVMAVVNGVACSAAAPVLMQLFASFG